MRLFNVLVGVIPISGENVLLTQRHMSEKFMPGAWGLPAGKIDFGETLEHAAVRELREETGLSGSVRQLVGYSMFMSRKDENDLHNLQVNFIVDVSEADPVVLDKSSQAYRWVPLAEYQSLGLDDFTESTIKQAIQYL